MSELDVEMNEHLEASASLSHVLSHRLCEGSHVDQLDCSWYHRAWQYLRLFDMVSCPLWHEPFYSNAIKDCIDRGQNDVLVSGTADYTILGLVLEAVKSKQAKGFDVTVLDACETALALCEWYSLQVGHPVALEQSNILQYETSGESFDVVLSDAFFTRFDGPEKRDVADHWYQLLNESGTAITTIRIEPEVDRQIGSADDEVESFVDRARRNAREADALSVPLDVIADLARDYSENIVSYPVRSTEEASELFEDAGFSSISTDTATVKGEMKETTYCHLIATK